MMLDSVIRFLFDAVGSIISIKKISDTLTSSGRKISSHTVESYIADLGHLLENVVYLELLRRGYDGIRVINAIDFLLEK